MQDPRKTIGFFSLLSLLALFIFAGAIQSIASAFAIAADDPSIPHRELTQSELQSLINSSESDTQVQAYTHDKVHEVMSYDFVGDTDDKPFVWYPEIHINIENTTQLTVLFGKGQVTGNSVAEIRALPMMKPVQAVGDGTHHSYATNWYTGSSNPNGIRLSTTAPTRTGSGDVGMAFLLNGITLSSDDTKACNAAYFGNTYFAQTGYIWATGASVDWTDTAQNCVPQFPIIDYTQGASYDFKIYFSGSTWTIYGKNLSTSQVFTKTRSGVTSAVLKNNDYNTSVFLEGQTTSLHGNILTSPSGTSTISTNSGSTWTNWQSGSRDDQDCNHVDHIYPYDSSKEVISGNLASGGSATWNLGRMAANYPAC